MNIDTYILTCLALKTWHVVTCNTWDILAE